MPPIITVVQPGNTAAAHPYTIAVVANPALETDDDSATFVSDPIMADQAGFTACAKYVFDVLFGRLPGQAEQLLADPAIGPFIRVVNVFDAGLPVSDANSLVTQSSPNIAEPRRDKFTAFLAKYGILPDVAFAVTASPTHNRASAWYGTEDTTGDGVNFTLDGSTFKHFFFSKIPGTVALPFDSTSLTALHEFGHAASSFTDNMMITDQYVDSPPALNVKHGRPIPATFGVIAGQNVASDPTRNGLGYEFGWQSYHPELTDPTVPSLMDNYWEVTPPTVSESCVFDVLTRKFYFDRFMAKLSRP